MYKVIALHPLAEQIYSKKDCIFLKSFIGKKLPEKINKNNEMMLITKDYVFIEKGAFLLEEIIPIDIVTLNILKHILELKDIRNKDLLFMKMQLEFSKIEQLIKKATE